MPNNFCEQFLTYRDGPKCTDENTCDFSDPALLEKVKAFQPDPLDVKGTIIAEETKNLSNGLPRGTCNGSLVGGGDAPAPTPTNAPAPTPSPKCSSFEFLKQCNKNKGCSFNRKTK